MEKMMVNRWKVAKLAQLSYRIGKTVEIQGEDIALFRLGDGNVRAVENRCPHKGGTLSEGIVSGDFIYCPLHDWRICLGNGQVQEPDTGCIKTYEVTVEGEDVYIHV
jgi:nitrite reductase (NADH) small subunit